MAVELVRPPDKFMFSGNFMPIRFKSTDLVESPAKAAVNKIKFIGDNIGVTIQIRFAGYTVDMVGVQDPDNSGYQFYGEQVVNDPGFGWTTRFLIPYFEANYFLNQFFDITTEEDFLIFTAKTAGKGFDFIPAAKPTYSITNTTLGEEEKLKENYAVYFQLFLENEEASGFDSIYNAYLPLMFDTDGITKIDIHDRLNTALLNAIYKNGIEAPIMSDLDTNKCLRSARTYYFKYAESYAGKILEVKTSPFYSVILGALSYVGQHLVNQLTLFNPGTKSQDRFLWQGPKNINTRFDTPQFFYFYNNRETIENVNAAVKFYFKDGTSASKTLKKFNLYEDRKYSFNLRFDVLHYFLIAPDETINTKIVTHYEVNLQKAEALSETLTFTVDRSYQRQVRYFLYLSSLGTLDTLTAVGVGKNGFDIEQQESGSNRQPFGATGDGESVVFDVALKHKFSVAVGWETSREDFARKRDFFASPKKYRYVNGYLLPIKITSKSIDESQDGRTLNAHILEYEYLFSDNAYSEFDAEEPNPNNLTL